MRRSERRESKEEAGEPHLLGAASSNRRRHTARESARSVGRRRGAKVADVSLPLSQPLQQQNETKTDRLALPRARARPRDRRLGGARQRLPGAPPPLALRRRGEMCIFFFFFLFSFFFLLLLSERATARNGGGKRPEKNFF